jgi:hypothetical protein
MVVVWGHDGTTVKRDTFEVSPLMVAVLVVVCGVVLRPQRAFIITGSAPETGCVGNSSQMG